MTCDVIVIVAIVTMSYDTDSDIGYLLDKTSYSVFQLAANLQGERICDSMLDGMVYDVIHCLSNLQGEKIPRTTHVDLNNGYLLDETSYKVFQLAVNLQAEKIL